MENWVLCVYNTVEMQKKKQREKEIIFLKKIVRKMKYLIYLWYIYNYKCTRDGLPTLLIQMCFQLYYD